MVSNSQYGTWLFTTSDKAWKFIEQAITLDRKYDTGWTFSILTDDMIAQWHHPWEWDLLKRIDNNIDDLKDVIEYVDNLDYKNLIQN